MAFLEIQNSLIVSGVTQGFVQLSGYASWLRTKKASCTVREGIGKTQTIQILGGGWWQLCIEKEAKRLTFTKTESLNVPK